MMVQLIFAPTSTTPLSSSLLPLLPPTAAIALSEPPTSPATSTTTAGDGADGDELI